MTQLARRATLALAVFMAALLGPGTDGYSQGGRQQCYHRPGIDPPSACSACADTCLGAGYLCCTIIVET